MLIQKGLAVQLYDFHPTFGDLTAEILSELQKPLKHLPSKLFYNELGSQLFEQICELDEYYPTRTELAIMQTNITEIAHYIGEKALLIEYGSGSSLKIRTLLENLSQLAAYIPIDISREQLVEAAETLALDYPDLNILAVCADYTQPIKLPDLALPFNKRIIYYPGSTIGNFPPKKAVTFLTQMHQLCGSDGGALIGVDLKKDPQQLHNAYNDARGVTAAFNLNMLTYINEITNADFDLQKFAHFAFYNELIGAIEMHLISLIEQTVHINNTPISFSRYEHILTEHSYKYSLSEFAQLANQAGFQVKKVWTDENERFSVQYLTAQ